MRIYADYRHLPLGFSRRAPFLRGADSGVADADGL